ncbi:MAG: hypothetical protein RML10_12820 [Geminocystis sp.]|nr:hypothetical protein [Geminocystis sp.]MDW8464427.1 hypothetical protein [Geminocystis sp.]
MTIAVLGGYSIEKNRCVRTPIAKKHTVCQFMNVWYILVEQDTED